MERDKVKMEFFGDLSPLSQELRDLCEQTRRISKRYDGCQVNICLNYGGRDEILRAARAYALDCVEGRGGPQPPDTGELLRLPVLPRGAGPGPDYPPQRGAAPIQFPAVGVRLCGVLLYGCAVAGFQQSRAAAGPSPAIRAGPGDLEVFEKW